MQAMVLIRPGEPLAWQVLPDPEPAAQEVRIRVEACGVCRTDLHVVDGELPQQTLPLIPGHEIVGVVEAVGPGVDTRCLGSRVGVAWLGHTCGQCHYCRSDRENLCDTPRFTGYTRPGGYATHVVADARFVFPMPRGPAAETLAPLLCAGLIGWRALAAAGAAERLGLYGFGAAAHLVTQVAHAQGRQVYAFTRPGDGRSQRFARDLGARWAGDSDAAPPDPLDAAILFAPVGELVPRALQAIVKGGKVVCAGIHMSDLPSFPYRLLWEERQLLSVANLTRRDGREFLAFAARHPVASHTTCYPLEQANEALDDLRHGRFDGAAVLMP